MKILELFAGSRSLGKIAEQMGHEVFSSDLNAFDDIHYVTDIFNFDINKLPWKPDENTTTQKKEAEEKLPF